MPKYFLYPNVILIFVMNLKQRVMGAYEFIVNLHKRGGSIINQYVCRGGTHIEYKESNSDELKETFLNRA